MADTLNKTFPAIIAEEAKIAISHYPELKDTKIDFIFAKNIKKSFMQAQPKWYSVFQNRKKRHYIIKITPVFVLQGLSIPVENLPKDVLIGWLGHELGHVLDYSGRSGLSMIGFGIGYVTSPRYKIGAERVADMNAITHGLGENILATKKFIMEHAHIKQEYKQRMKRYYMSPEEAMQLIEGNLKPIKPTTPSSN